MTDHLILFRADGNNSAGLGHLARSAALASMLKGSYKCILATKCPIQSFLRKLENDFAEIIQLPEQDSQQEVAMLNRLLPVIDLVVLDGYYFGEQYQLILKENKIDFFCIDDIHAYSFHSRAVINHSGGLTPLDYNAEPYTQFYLGPLYSLIRPEFQEASAYRRRRVEDKNCFICFGGSDPVNKTLEILKFPPMKGIFERLHVVVGSAYSHLAELEDFAVGKEGITIYHSVSASEMLAVMRKCSHAVCSPSTVLYEYLSVGGLVYLEQTAGNQEDVIRYFTGEGMAFRLEQLGRLSESDIQESFAKQAFFFDGKSGERFCRLFSRYFDSKRIIIRRAQLSDAHICFTWANDPLVREQSYNQSAIDYESHLKWFAGRVSDPYTYYYILEIKGSPVAQIRFQVSGNQAVLGYLADAGLRNKGLGTVILEKGIERFVQDYDKPVRIIGFVKNSNISSQRSFERFAFTKEASSEYPDSVKYSMYYGR